MRILNRPEAQKQALRELESLGFDEIKAALGLKRWKRKEMAWPLERLVAVFMVFQVSGVPSLKAFWAAQSEAAAEAGGPPWPSYNTLHKWHARCEGLFSALLSRTLSPLGQRLGFVDSMKLPIGEPYRWVKSMGRQAGLGHSACGECFGMKLHALVSESGDLCAARTTAANVHDLAPIKAGWLDGQCGRVYADKGYVGREVYFSLMRKNLFLWAKPRDNMGLDTQWSFDVVQEWRLRHAKAYRKRIAIERFFGQLKKGFNLTIQGLRSPRSARARIFGALLCRQWVRSGVLACVRVV